MIEHKRNKDIDFDPEAHTYMYKGYKKFDGVTSWIAEYNEPFNAKKIARKLAQWRDESAQDILDKWDETREYGNYVHENVENYVNGGGYIETDEIKNFKEILDKHNLESLASEWVVYDEDINRASAIDLVCKNHNGRYVVVDIKTRHKGIEAKAYKGKTMYAPLDNLPASRYFKYCLQVNIYAYWLRNKYDLDVSPVNYILNLTDEGAELIPVVDLTSKIEEMYQLKISE